MTPLFQKTYVSVLARFNDDGTIIPRRIYWKDGHYFDIDVILDVRKAASLKVGGTGLRFILRIRGHQTKLFYDQGRWFVEERTIV